MINWKTLEINYLNIRRCNCLSLFRKNTGRCYINASECWWSKRRRAIGLWFFGYLVVSNFAGRLQITIPYENYNAIISEQDVKMNTVVYTNKISVYRLETFEILLTGFLMHWQRKMRIWVYLIYLFFLKVFMIWL